MGSSARVEEKEAVKYLTALLLAVSAALGLWNYANHTADQAAIADKNAVISQLQDRATTDASKIAELQASQATTDANPYTTKLSLAFCAGDAQGVYDALAPGSSTRNGLNGEADYYAKVIDQNTSGAAALITEAGLASGTDVTALLAALDVKAAALKAQNSPVAILAAEIKLPDGTTCSMQFKGSYADRYGAYVAVYIITYHDADGSRGGYFIFTAGTGGVESIE